MWFGPISAPDVAFLAALVMAVVVDPARGSESEPAHPIADPVAVCGTHSSAR
ncbi:MAG: hypothetical protein ACYCV7_17630 [Acidimicrobiales bacterium]